MSPSVLRLIYAVTIHHLCKAVFVEWLFMLEAGTYFVMS